MNLKLKELKKVKLVIWDLDETFWKGTLSEEGITVIPQNIAIVKTLAERGIVSSICSKNNMSDAKSQLVEMGVWDYFVFPKIAWLPKGTQVANTISEMNLRPENCVFVDDNQQNLAEVEQACPGLVAMHPEDIIPHMLDAEVFQGKEDSELTRLTQYRNLQARHAEHTSSNMSNVDFFLKTCDLKISINHDVESHFDRVLELIERTNQLNYTKKRMLGASDIEKLKAQIADYKTYAAVVSASDKYGDYGVVGFILITQFDSKKARCEHFVFSCRVLHMGVEGYIFEKLRSPKIDVVDPVAYSVSEYGAVDWITEVDADTQVEAVINPSSALLLGPCHLAQLGSFFGAEYEFFQYESASGVVKFDCPAFLGAPLSKVEDSSFIAQGYSWSIQEFKDFRASLRGASQIILSLEDLLSDRDYVFEDGIYYRYEGVKKCGFPTRKLAMEERVDVLFNFLNMVLEEKKDSADVYVLDCIISAKLPEHLKGVRIAYSHSLYKYFSGRLRIIDPSSYVSQESHDSSDGVHLNRYGYFELAQDLKHGNVRAARADYSSFDNGRNLKMKFFNFRLRVIRSLGEESTAYRLLRYMVGAFKIRRRG